MSLRKDALAWGFTIFAVTLAVAAALFIILPQLHPRTTVHVGDGVFHVLVEQTDADRETALSSVTSLVADQGFLFIYDTIDKWPITMKDVTYSVDAIWLDKNKEIIHIIKNVPSDSYPEQFAPAAEAKYILLLPAGTVDARKISVGKKASFNENNLDNWL